MDRPVESSIEGSSAKPKSFKDSSKKIIAMVSEQKKLYMKKYNKKPETKARKAEYMRKARALADKEASQKLVRNLLDLGFENLAFEYAQERAPEMLITQTHKASLRNGKMRNIFS